MIQDQPPPKRNDGQAIWDLVIADAEDGSSVFGLITKEAKDKIVADMHERKDVGIKRYGVSLQAHNGRDAIIDAYQEALDAAAYLRQAQEEGDAWASVLYKEALTMIIGIRARIIMRDGK